MRSFKDFLNEQDDISDEKARNKKIRLSRQVNQAKGEIENEGERARAQGRSGAQVGKARRSALSDLLGINLPDNMQTDMRTEAAETKKDYEGEMAHGELYNIIDNAQAICKMLKPDSQLEAWVQSKITKANDYINAVHDYLKNTPGSVG